MVCMYSTLRVVKIPSKCLGITYFVIVIGILGYIGGFGLAYSKGYQVVVPAQSVAVTKVKGSTFTSFTDQELGVPNPQFYRRIWDAQDIVTPPHGGENGGFFIMTNLIITPNQKRDICPENPDLTGAVCKGDQSCQQGKSVKNGNGIMTGKCVKDAADKDPAAKKTCQVHAWCPVERNLPPLKGQRALLTATKDFTVLVKNTIEFPQLGPRFIRRNIKTDATESYLQNCIYNAKTDPYCPTFRIGDIVEGAGFNYDQVALNGGVFSLTIKWSCSFDWGYTIDDCLPTYSFGRLDDAKTNIAPGWNFRSVIYHEENRRTLTQQYGIKVLIEVEGEGRKFDSIRFLLTVGAGLGFFALASLICDFCLDLFCKLQEYSKAAWLAYFSEEMKYDLQFVREYERAKYGPAKQGNEQVDLQSPVISP